MQVVQGKYLNFYNCLKGIWKQKAKKRQIFAPLYIAVTFAVSHYFKASKTYCICYLLHSHNPYTHEGIPYCILKNTSFWDFY